MDKKYLIIILFICFLLFSWVIPVSGKDAVKSTITVNNADSFRKVEVGFNGNLTSALEDVLARVSVQYANTLRKLTLSQLRAGFQEVIKQVSARVVINQANSNRQADLIYPKELINDSAAPLIDQVDVDNLSESKVKVNWITDEFATSKVRFGTSAGSYTKSVEDARYKKEHALPLSGLSAGGTYYYQIETMDLSGNKQVSSEKTFTVVKDPTFSDVPLDYWAFDWIEAIASAGITSGYPDGTYRPGNPVTRAEMAVFLLKGMNAGTYEPPAPDSSHPFSDIAGHWAEDWMEELYDVGLTSGYPDGTYRPQNQVTRAEMAVFLLRAKHGAGYSPPAASGGAFSDVGGHWAEGWIEQLADEGITGGYPDGTYRPNNPVNRAEMAVFLTKAFNLSLP